MRDYLFWLAMLILIVGVVYGYWRNHTLTKAEIVMLGCAAGASILRVASYALN